MKTVMVRELKSSKQSVDLMLSMSSMPDSKVSKNFTDYILMR